MMSTAANAPNAMIPDLYGPTHDAMRLALAEFLTAVARGDAAPAGAVTARWLDVARLIESHARAEADAVYPMLRLAAPAIAAELGVTHAALAEAADAIGASFAALATFGAADRRRSLRAALLLARHFVADCLRHLADEESRAKPALVAHFPPVALFAARRALIARLAAGGACPDLSVISASADRAAATSLARMAALRDADAFATASSRIIADAIDALDRGPAPAERLAA